MDEGANLGAVGTSITWFASVVAACVIGILALAILVRTTIRRRVSARRAPELPAAPQSLYQWLAEVRRSAQDQYGLRYLEFEHPLGSERHRFLLAWKDSALQLRISSNRGRFRFASIESPAGTRFDVAPPTPETRGCEHLEDRFWQFEADGWVPVHRLEQHAQGLMFAKLFFVCWQNHAGRQSAGRLTT